MSLAFAEYKERGIVYFDEKIEEALSLEEAVERELTKASNNGFDDEFYLVYQPQFDLRTKKIVGLEALARWNSRELGHISPLKFISIAEKYQLILPLGDWILDRALRDIKRLENLGFSGIKTSVNISAIQMLQKGFVDKLLEKINEIGINPENLGVEITETIIMNDYRVVNRKLKKIRDEGIYVSLDDFGVGYSSLGRMKDLNIDILKIDKTFIDDINTNKKKDVFLEGIISLARKIDLKIVAEGIEREDQKDFLLLSDCPIMQGFLFSRPVEFAEVIKMIKESYEE